MLKRVLLGMLALMALGGAAFALYWRLTRFDRTLDEVEHGLVFDDAWQILREKPEDPRVILAAQHTFERSYAGPDDDGQCQLQYETLAKGAARVLEAHPATSSEAAKRMSTSLVACADARPMKWVKVPLNELVAAMGSQQPFLRKSANDAAVKALVALDPVVGPEVFATLIAFVATSPTAEGALFAGLPPNGKPLSDVADRMDAKSDPRLAVAVNDWLRGRSSLTKEELTLLARFTKLVKVTLDEKAIRALAGSEASPELAAVARILIGPSDVELVRRVAPPAREAFLLGPLSGTKEVDTILGAVRSTYAAKDPDDTDSRIDAYAKSLVAIGPLATGPLRVALVDESWAVRDVAGRALSKLDHSAYAQGVADAIHAKKADARDAWLALELVDESPLEPGPVFASLSLGNDAVNKKATSILTRRSRPAEWVPALFANIVVGEKFYADTVATYAMLLAGAATAPFVATALQAELERAHGSPDRVYWLIKHLALDALTAYGTKAERGVVEKFATDPSRYDLTTTTKKKGELEVTKTTKGSFASDATTALNAIDERAK